MQISEKALNFFLKIKSCTHFCSNYLVLKQSIDKTENQSRHMWVITKSFAFLLLFKIQFRFLEIKSAWRLQ